MLVTDLYFGCGMHGTDVAETSLGPDDRFPRKPFRIGTLIGVVEELAAGQAVPGGAPKNLAGLDHQFR